MDRAPVRYARSGDVNIAYQVTGDGPFDLVVVPGFFSHFELDWEHPAARRWIEQDRGEFELKGVGRRRSYAATA